MGCRRRPRPGGADSDGAQRHGRVRVTHCALAVALRSQYVRRRDLTKTPHASSRTKTLFNSDISGAITTFSYGKTILTIPLPPLSRRCPVHGPSALHGPPLLHHPPLLHSPPLSRPALPVGGLRPASDLGSLSIPLAGPNAVLGMGRREGVVVHRFGCATARQPLRSLGVVPSLGGRVRAGPGAGGGALAAGRRPRKPRAGAC